MDTIPSYEENSRSGGASGELVIRYALEEVLKENGVSVHVVRSDPEFDQCQMNTYDIILLDSWTWAMKGWVPKRNIRGHEKKIYILDFFGAQSMRGNSLNISPKQILTAFKSPWNSFLGYYIHPDRIEKLRPLWEKKLKQGVIWGKDPKHYDNKHDLIQKAADISSLISTSTVQVEHHANIKWVGHLTSEQWFEHLARSKFLLGLGNPLLGPSAIDAVSLGCMFIDPIYKTQAHIAKYISQHPYLHTALPEYVCTYPEGNAEELAKCVKKALATNLPPKIPDELTREAYVNRVKEIFGL
jgi:CheY-like chemotaxis protein